MNDNMEFGKAFMIGEVLIGELIADATLDEDRKQRMRRTCAQKARSAREVYGDLTDDSFSHEYLRETLDTQSEALRMRLLIMHFDDDPFDPHEIKFADKTRKRALTEHLNRLEEEVDLSMIDDSLRHGKIFNSGALGRRLARVGPLGVALGAIAGLASAPVIALYIGVAAGLTGAAAIAHGLAVLGGGTLAAGGYGMVGGLISTSSGGALLSGGGSTLAAALRSLDHDAFVNELHIEAALFHLLFTRADGSSFEARPWIDAVVTRADEFKEFRQEEERFSDPKSRPIKALHEQERQLRRLAQWMSDLVPEPV